MEFASMIKKVTGRSPLPSYTFYGCYCGIGGHGNPLDDIDWCCHAHDCCYGQMDKKSCNPISKPYHFSFRNRVLSCDSSNSKCASEVCECDRAATLCFKKHDQKYASKYTFHPDSKCSQFLPDCNSTRA
ncbi:acidic phospholipase A2 Cc1-PLA2-like isoform X2 [Ascaphus truei]